MALIMQITWCTYLTLNPEINKLNLYIKTNEVLAC